MDHQHLREIRECELKHATFSMPEGSTILEIGAGAGWQAKALSECGFQVEAIDLEDSAYSEARVCHVIEYDGMHIPFPDNYFDVVFSSNVLEHIPHIEKFQSEIHRVLKPTGKAIHILPTSSWRFWTNLSHYPNLIKVAVNAALSRFVTRSRTEKERANGIEPLSRRYSMREILRYLLFSLRHGARGNSLSELYWFSCFRWIRLFSNTGWILEDYYPARIFYTGNLLIGSMLTVKFRRLLSFILGSSCNIYVLMQSEMKNKTDQS